MNKQDKIEQILQSLDANQRASAPDFFYTRLKARMESNGLKILEGSALCWRAH